MQADWKEELLNEDQGIELILDENPEETDYQITSPKMSPWIKLGLIGGGIVATGGAITILFLIVSSVVNAQTGEGEATAEDLSAYKNTPQLTSSDADTELLAKLSDRQLNEEIQAVTPKAKTKTTQPDTVPKKTATPPTSTTADTPPPPTRVVTPPKVIYRDRPAQPVATPKTPPPKTITKTVYRDRPAPPTTVKSTVAITPTNKPKQKVDPYEEWERLAGLGSFGGGAIEVQKQPFTIAEAITPAVPVYEPAPQAYRPPIETGVSVAVGETVSGKLLTPIIFAEDMSAEGEQVLIELTGTLGDGVLPKGSMIVAKVSSVSSTGAIALKPESAIVAGNERSLPSDALKISNGSGGYLIAKQRRGNDPFVNDILGAALSGIGNSAGLLNRPRQQTQIANSGIIQQVTTNNDEDLLGGLVEGFTSQLAERSRSRLQARTDSRSPLFTVKQGSKVRLMVTRQAKF